MKYPQVIACCSFTHMSGEWSGLHYGNGIQRKEAKKMCGGDVEPRIEPDVVGG
jgi:hypothetical protein